MLIAGVFAWLQVLARESGAAAEEESRRQTRLLLEEIGAHRKTDAKLARARQVAEAANLAKTRFVVGVSHELRTPLNAVLGYAQLLEHDASIPEARREAIRIIRRSGEHLQGLIEGLMDISKIEAGRIEIERREIRFPEFLDQITGMFRVQAAAKGIHFRIQYPPNLPQTVFTDETRLRQILINLLSNALKFTEHGEVGLLVRLPGEVMEFEVTDTGPGIPPEHLERIFEPFERAAAAPPRASALASPLPSCWWKFWVAALRLRASPASAAASACSCAFRQRRARRCRRRLHGRSSAMTGGGAPFSPPKITPCIVGC